MLEEEEERELDGRPAWLLVFEQPCTVALSPIFSLSAKKGSLELLPASLVRVQELVDDYPSSSKIAFFTLVGTGAYFSGSITELARPVLIERSSVV